MGNEKNFENRVKRYLTGIGCYAIGTEEHRRTIPPIGWYEKRWGGGTFTKSGLPDMHVSLMGRDVELELKAEKGSPSPLQIHKLKQMDQAGTFAILLYPEDFGRFQDFVSALLHGDEGGVRNIYEQLTWRTDEWGRKYNL